VDFQFGTKVKDIETSVKQNQRTITCLSVSQGGLELKNTLGPDDIVIASLGSTVSGSAVGTNNLPPAWRSVQPSDHLDENWSLWLEAGTKYQDLGNPYTFCTRKSESMLQSFTITTENVEFFDYLNTLSQCKSEAGTVFIIKDCSWGLNLCIPSQPVFSQQPRNVRVLWGFGRFPDTKGDYVNKSMVYCSGAQLMSEILYHLNLPHEMAPEVLQRSITIPRAMPRMSSTLLTRNQNDRPRIIPQSISNLGLVGPFVEIPGRTCADISYGVDAARIAVSHLMGLQPWPEEPSDPSISRLLATLLWK
jgi:oleate hydratase